MTESARYNAVRNPSSPRIGSLCSGYGGLELGLMAVVGGSVAWHVEYDKHPSAVLEARFPGVPNYGDVTTTDWTQVEPVDWLTAGYPCQPFSTAGRRQGANDERHLWPFVADAIGALRPRRVLLENVAGHVSLGLDAVLWDLAALGYDATWGVVRASDAGAPHRRERIFIVAADTQCEREPGRRTPRDLGGTPAGRAGEGLQRERHRDAANDRGSAAPDPRGGPFPGATAARDGLSVAPERGGEPAPDTKGSVQSDGAEGAHTAALVSSRARAGGGVGAGPTAAGTNGLVGTTGVEWGPYGPAVRRWELVIGRAAPRPTESGRTGERLSPLFVEWMMGLPAGHVTDVLPRNPALKALGNGVVSQQAALAVRTLLGIDAVAA